MDAGETIFKGLVRAVRKLRGAGQAPSPAAVAWRDAEGRWTLLASLLCGTAMELKPAEGQGGGVVGDVLLLPRWIDVADTAEDNAGLYRYRIAYASVSRGLGLHLPGQGWDAHGARLMSLLAVPRVRGQLHRDYPGTGELEERLHPWLRAGRPAADPKHLAGLLEALTQRLLGVADPLGSQAPSQAQQALDALQEFAEGQPELSELASQARTRARQLAGQLPGGRGTLGPPALCWGELLPPPAPERSELTEDAGEPGQGPEAERNVVQLDRTIRLQRRRQHSREDKPLYHMFEKIETADEYGGESGTPDEGGDVRQMQDAVQELSLGTAIRTTDDPRNLVRAEVLVDDTTLEVAESPAVDGRVFRYPEWDHKRERYRDDWCTLVEQRYLAGDGGGTNLAAAREILRRRRRQVEDIRGHLMRALFRRETRKRQTDGPDIDVEAMVERHADLTAGHTPPERLYLSARKAPREIAVLLLLDTSFSTDAWVAGRRVLDIEIEALLILAEAFEGHLEEEVAVASFHSHTRNDVRFGVLKGFEDSWVQLRRVAPGLKPQGYTRIGTALRHATAVLDAAEARHKLLLLVSDGKPTDYDRYEGRHGIEDVARAVREGHQRGVRTFGVAIEKEAKLHLARMLGPGAYRILPRTSLLADVMGEVFVGLVAG